MRPFKILIIQKEILIAYDSGSQLVLVQVLHWTSRVTKHSTKSFCHIKVFIYLFLQCPRILEPLKLKLKCVISITKWKCKCYISKRFLEHSPSPIGQPKG